MKITFEKAPENLPLQSFITVWNYKKNTMDDHVNGIVRSFLYNDESLRDESTIYMFHGFKSAIARHIKDTDHIIFYYGGEKPINHYPAGLFSHLNWSLANA